MLVEIVLTLRMVPMVQFVFRGPGVNSASEAVVAASSEIVSSTSRDGVRFHLGEAVEEPDIEVEIYG